MKRNFLIALIALPALAACGAMPVQSPQTYAGQALAETNFRTVDAPDRLFDGNENIVRYYAGPDFAFGDDLVVTRPLYTGSDTRIIIVTVRGFEDDSVSAEQWKLTVVPEGGRLRVSRAEVRYQCARGGTGNNWTSHLCP